MSWIGINNDFFKQTAYLVGVAEMDLELFSSINEIEKLTKLYFDIEIHLIKILDFVKQNQITEKQFMKLEYNFKKLTDLKLEYFQKINQEIYKSLKEVYFFYDDVQDNLNNDVSSKPIKIEEKNTYHIKLKSYTGIIPKKNDMLSKKFEVGLKFATGQVYEYFELNKIGKYVSKDKLSFEIITEKLFLKSSLRPFVSDTVNKNDRSGTKNVFADKKVMFLLKKYCIEEGIEMCQEFAMEIEIIERQKN